MSNPTPIDPFMPESPTVVIERVIERADQLLSRYEALQRTNALLREEINALTYERDSLRSRLSAARSRVDALLARLPENTAAATNAATGADL